jgi:geranylgeranyl transferase type-2 subunit beta
VSQNPPYLQTLAIRLAAGMEQVPEEVRQRHANYMRSLQQPDGGFAGRQGESDLYYTSFALRGLSILGELYGDVAASAARFLRQRMASKETLIDRISLVFGAALLDVSAGIDLLSEPSGAEWKRSLGADLEALRCSDGGFAKGPGGSASSTYHTFLALLCLQLIGQPVRDNDAIVAFLLSQRATDGGFREIRVGKRAGTNPTAAAVGALRILGAVDDELADSTADFLAEMQDNDGGLLANARIPLADLLSTFTGLFTLADLGRLEALDLPAARQFVRTLAHAEGGFLAAVWDEVRDVEYTFYGLGSLSLLAAHTE